jgi:uncharacterized protein
MQFNVSQLLKEAAGASRQRQVAGELFDIDENNPGPVEITGEVSLIRTVRGILVKGTVHATLMQPCRRCLETAPREVDIEIEEEYVPSIDIYTGASLPITDDDEPELVIDEHHTLALDEVLRQMTVVASTVPTVCSQECKGFCPICGCNLNTETCECDTSQIDPRLAVLAQLLDEEE